MTKDYATIDTARLKSDISQIETDLVRAEKETQDMFTAVVTLNQMWKGPANTAFNQQFISDYNRMKNHLANLRKFKQRLEEDKAAYETCEAKVFNRVNALKV